MSARLAAALAAALSLSIAPASAHEGHDHGAVPGASAPASVGGARADAVTNTFELVAIANGTALSLYLDDFATNVPIDRAMITVETPSGSLEAVPHGDHYRAEAPFLATPGRYDLIITIAAGTDIEVVPLSLTTSPDNGMATGLLAQGQRMTAWTPYWLLGWAPWAGVLLLGLGLGYGLARLTRRRTAAIALLLLPLATGLPERGEAHTGHDHGDEKVTPIAASGERAQRLSDGTLYVPKPAQRIFGVRTTLTERRAFSRTLELPGRVIADPNASGFVQASVGGRLSPPSGGFPRLGAAVRKGDVLAYVAPPIQQIDVSDMRQRQGELDQQISIVETRLARYTLLTSSGAVARQQLEEAQIELQGLKDRRAALDVSRREPEALAAPVDGIVADGTPVAGQIAQPNAVIFHIVDPGRLWVEALSFDTITPTTATATTASGRSLKLAFRGSGFADRNQSNPVHFAIESNAAGLRAGQFVTVQVALEEQREGVAVPRSAVVRNANGQDFVFEHTAPERFVARSVRIGPLDGDRVLILAGIGAGRRVVIQGAELLDHVR